jgi:hypothetical protein
VDGKKKGDKENKEEHEENCKRALFIASVVYNTQLLFCSPVCRINTTWIKLVRRGR